MPIYDNIFKSLRMAKLVDQSDFKLEGPRLALYQFHMDPIVKCGRRNESQMWKKYL